MGQAPDYTDVRSTVLINGHYFCAFRPFISALVFCLLRYLLPTFDVTPQSVACVCLAYHLLFMFYIFMVMTRLFSLALIVPPRCFLQSVTMGLKKVLEQSSIAESVNVSGLVLGVVVSISLFQFNGLPIKLKDWGFKLAVETYLVIGSHY